MDLIGESIYDFFHPLDHNELRQELSFRPHGELGRSFFLRLKSTLNTKGTSKNKRAATYKVWIPFLKQKEQIVGILI